MAPEACDANVLSFSGKAADVWAYGITLFCVVFLRVPFIADTEYQLMELIRTTELKVPTDERSISANLNDLLLKVLDKDPTTRLTISEVVSHPFFK